MCFRPAAQTQSVVSSCTQIPNASTTTGMVAGLPPPSFPGNVYTSIPLVPFYPSISVPPVSSSVEQQLQLQQPTSATPVVSVQSLMNQSHASPFPTMSTSSPSVYVPSLMQQLTFSGGQGQFMPTGRNQSSPLSTVDQISADSSALLKRVSVPKFFGQKKNYESWKAAFYSCVDRTGATPEYKLLRLRECLHGEPLRVIENLGHSAAAYEAAKSRLEQKYGGKRRALTLRLEELNAFKPVREGNERDLEKLSEVLDGIVVDLKDASLEAELGNGSLYIALQRKFNKELLSKYKQWVSDNHRTENVSTLREFIDRESEFLTTALETISGVLKESPKKERNSPTAGSSFVTRNSSLDKKKPSQACKVCNGQHGIWSCESFKRMTAPKRWEVATGHTLCFCCLADGHRGEECFRSSVCGQNGCRSYHHRMLH